jgi:hypothetical protein
MLSGLIFMPIGAGLARFRTGAGELASHYWSPKPVKALGQAAYSTAIPQPSGVPVAPRDGRFERFVEGLPGGTAFGDVSTLAKKQALMKEKGGFFGSFFKKFAQPKVTPIDTYNNLLEYALANGVDDVDAFKQFPNEPIWLPSQAVAQGPLLWKNIEYIKGYTHARDRMVRYFNDLLRNDRLFPTSMTPLKDAILRKSPAAVKSLLDAGAQSNFNPAITEGEPGYISQYAHSPLWLAIQQEDLSRVIDLLQLLIEHKVDVNITLFADYVKTHPEQLTQELPIDRDLLVTPLDYIDGKIQEAESYIEKGQSEVDAYYKRDDVHSLVHSLLMAPTKRRKENLKHKIGLLNVELAKLQIIRAVLLNAGAKSGREEVQSLEALD